MEELGTAMDWLWRQLETLAAHKLFADLGEALAFGLLCGLFAIVFVVLDWLLFRVVPRHIIPFAKRGFLSAISIWFIGATLTGFLGRSFGILEATTPAAIFAGFAWPAIVMKIVDTLGEKYAGERDEGEGEEEPLEGTGDEEEEEPEQR